MDLSKLSDSDLQQIAKGDMRMVSSAGLKLMAGEQEVPKEQDLGTKAINGIAKYMYGKANTGFGAIRGAAGIGATIAQPFQYAYDQATGKTDKGLSNLITGKEPLSTNEEMRSNLDTSLQGLGADPTADTYQGGKLSTEIGLTLPIGGAIGNGAKALGATKLGNAIASGGFNLGSNAQKAMSLEGLANGATRMLGGAINGGATAGLVDPKNAGTGAIIGGGLPVAVKGAAMLGSGIKNAAGGIASNTLGLTTGAGANSVKEAYQAGKTGNQAFIDNMRGDASVDDIVNNAKSALSKMSSDKSAEYRSGMSAISNDKSVLDFSGIDKAMSDASKVASFKGQSTNTQASKAFDDIKSVIDEWKQLDPAEFHTPEGLDALKKKIGGIQESIPFEQKTARNVAGKVYNAIKDEISSQAPTYSKTMKGYADASNQISEIEKSLSLGKKANIDTSVRKLQSLMRNNVNTNYGNRLTLAKELENKGGADLLPSIAGQAMNTWTPRGIQGGVIGGAGGAAAFMNPSSLLALPFASPRLVGETAYKLGSAASKVGSLPGGITSNKQLLELQRLIATNPNLYKGLLSIAQPISASQ